MRGGVLLKRRDDGGGNALSAVRRVDVDALNLEGLLVHALPRAAAGRNAVYVRDNAAVEQMGQVVLRVAFFHVTDKGEVVRIERCGERMKIRVLGGNET